MSQYSRNYDAVVDALALFNRAALDQLRATALRRLWRWRQGLSVRRTESEDRPDA